MRIVGVGTRVLEFLVDLSIITLITFGVKRGWDFYVFYYRLFFLPFFYILAIIGFVYYLFFEAIWQRTPGKWITLTRVVTKAGNKPNFFQILTRSAVRVAGVILIDSIFLSFMNKTLHDYISKTEVIEV